MNTQVTHFAALRRNTRMPARIPVRVKKGNVVWDSVTADVSVSGAFVLCSSAHIEEGDELKLRFWMPDTLEFIALDGECVRRGDVEGAEGIGVELRGGEGSERWEAFMERMLSHVVSRSSWSIGGVEMEYTWRGLSLDALDELLHVDLFIGGVFVETELHCEVGSRLGLNLVHPIDGSMLRINTKVTGLREVGARGVCVEFTDPTPVLIQRVRAFIEEGLPGLNMNPVLMERAAHELLRAS